MECLRCHHQNAPDAKFCEECGAELVPVKYCEQCGFAQSVNNRFCEECGEPMATIQPLRESTPTSESAEDYVDDTEAVEQIQETISSSMDHSSELLQESVPAPESAEDYVDDTAVDVPTEPLSPIFEAHDATPVAPSTPFQHEDALYSDQLEQPVGEPHIICSQCGKSQPASNQFCEECGHPLHDLPEAQHEYVAAHAVTPEPATAIPTEEATIYCLNCGALNPSTNKFCRECGAELVHEQSPVRQQASDWQRYLPWAVIAVVLGLIIGGYLYGKSYYSPNAYIRRINTAITADKPEQLAKIMTADDKQFTPSKTNVQPVVDYFKNDTQACNRLLSSFRAGEDYEGFALVPGEKAFFLFDTYHIRAKTFRQEVSVKDHGTVSLNDKVLFNTDGPAQVDLGPFLTGAYEFDVKEGANHFTSKQIFRYSSDHSKVIPLKKN